MRLTDRFDRAFAYATQLHRAQTRKVSGTPYLGHLLAVTAIVIEHGGSEDEAIAALLHDAVEDQGGATTREDIRARFGDNVARMVDACSDSDIWPKPPWKERKQLHLQRARTAEPSVRLVLAADKLHNLRTLFRDYQRIGERLWEHFRGGKEGTLWYYREMLAALGASGETPLLAQCAQALRELESLVGE